MNIVISGATRGIGRSVALLFAEKGFDIAFCSRNAENIAALERDLRAVNAANALFAQTCDMSVKEEVQDFGRFCLDSFGSADILVNNAGIFLPGTIYAEADGTLEKLMDLNLYSAYHLTRMLVPKMMERRKGHIFNMCSVASINAYDAGGSYAISKFALLGFSKNLRHELKNSGIRVTAVIAGATRTDSWADVDLPAERFIKPEDIARLIWNAWELSENADVEEIVVRPRLGDI